MDGWTERGAVFQAIVPMFNRAARPEPGVRAAKPAPMFNRAARQNPAMRATRLNVKKPGSAGRLLTLIRTLLKSAPINAIVLLSVS